MKKFSRRELTAMLGSLCASTLFGLSYMFTKNILDDVGVFALLSWRYIFGTLALTLLAVFGVIHIDFKNKNPWPMLRMALYMPAAYYIFETYGIEFTSASESGTFLACIPIACVILAAIMLKEIPSKAQVFGVLLSTAGVIAIVLLKGAELSFSAIGYLFLLGATLVDALYTIDSRKLNQFSAVEKTYFMCLVGFVFFAVCALIESGLKGNPVDYLMLPFQDRDFLITALYLGLGCTTVSFLLLNRSISIIGPGRAGAFAGYSTVVSVVSGVLILHERFSLVQGIATVAVLLGVYLVNMEPQKDLDESA